MPPVTPAPESSALAQDSSPTPEAPAEPGVQPTAGPTRGTLPKAAVAAGIAEGNAAFEACYQRAARPGLRGTILVNFVVTHEGDVPHATALEQGTDLSDQGVIDCVLSAFKKLHFQGPSADRAVLTYPLKFEPKEGSP